MSVIRKTTPVGRDILIDHLQLWLYNQLSLTNYDSYHRVYKNDTEKGIIPEKYNNNGDYHEVLFNDDYNATSFFITEDEVDNNNGAFSSDVSIIFQVNLSKVYPSITHRADEEFINDVSLLLKRERFGFEFVNIQTGIDNVYREFNKTDIKWDNIGEFFVVRFNLKLGNYSYSCNTGLSATSKTCADVTVLDSDGVTIVEVVSGGYFECTPVVSVSGWAYSRPVFNDQNVKYADYDAKWLFDNGFYDYTPPPNPESVAYLIDFFTLGQNNQFGNTNRFTDYVGLQNYDGTGGSLTDYIIDHLTGLAIYRVSLGNITWTSGLTAANASTQHGFSDWYIPHQGIVADLMNQNLTFVTANRVMSYSPLSITSVRLWTSTTRLVNTANAITIDVDIFSNRGKALTADVYMVRNHYN